MKKSSTKRMQQNGRRKSLPQTDIAGAPPLSARPSTVPRTEWEQYEQLACELEGAECVVEDLRARLDVAKERLASRLAGAPYCRAEESFDDLAEAVPASRWVQ